ncbi:MAG: peptidoglycan-binding domain-containing protein [Acidobacteriota bacterium]
MDPVFPEERVHGCNPVGDGDHVVRQGECISSLAAQTGLRRSDIWNHPANARLREIRGNPNVLLPRDRVAIRRIEPKEQQGSTEQTHRFELASEPVFLRVQVLKRDEPLAGKPFTLTVEKLVIEDVTGPDGTIEVEVPPTATTAFLKIGAGEDLFQMRLKLGGLHPVETATGAQQRLQNLGFDCGPIDGLIGPRTRGAIRNFQAKFGLKLDGKLTPETRDQLRHQHGC